MPDEKCPLVGQADFSGQHSRLPPVSMGDDIPGRIYYRRDSGVAATGDPPTGLYRTQRGIGKVLPVAGSVSPPSIVRNDSLFKTFSLSIPDTSSHNTTQLVIYGPEYGGIRSHLHPDHKLVLVVSLELTPLRHHQCGVM